MPDQGCQSAGYSILLLFLCRKITALRWIVLNSHTALNCLTVLLASPLWMAWGFVQQWLGDRCFDSLKPMVAPLGQASGCYWSVWRVRNDQIIPRTLCTNKTVFVWSNSATTHVVWFFFLYKGITNSLPFFSFSLETAQQFRAGRKDKIIFYKSTHHSTLLTKRN